MIINYLKSIYIVRINLKGRNSPDLLWTVHPDA